MIRAWNHALLVFALVAAVLIATPAAAGEPEGPALEALATSIAPGVHAESAIPLGVSTASNRAVVEPQQEPGGSTMRSILSLGGVVAGAVGLGALVRKVARRWGGLMASIGPGGRAPSGLLEVLGRFPVSRGCTLVLLKLDRRVLLVSQSASRHGAGMNTLCEITDPEEVAAILVKARDEEDESQARRFEAMLRGEGAAVSRAVSDVVAPESRAIELIRRRLGKSHQVAEGLTA